MLVDGRSAPDHARRRDSAARGGATREPLVRSRWPARQRDRVADRGQLRCSGIADAVRRAQASHRRPLRPGRPRNRPGRPQPDAQPRAGARATCGPPGARARRPTRAAPDEADEGFAHAAVGGKAARVAAQADSPPAERGGLVRRSCAAQRLRPDGRARGRDTGIGEDRSPTADTFPASTSRWPSTPPGLKTSTRTSEPG